jgi:amino acid permease
MILIVYITLMSLSLILIFLGYHIEDPTLKTIGFAFIFIISFSTMTGGLDYHNGDLINKTDPNNEITIKQYENYPIRTISFFLTAIGLLGSSFTLYNHFNREED